MLVSSVLASWALFSVELYLVFVLSLLIFGGYIVKIAIVAEEATKSLNAGMAVLPLERDFTQYFDTPSNTLLVSVSDVTFTCSGQ